MANYFQLRSSPRKTQIHSCTTDYEWWGGKTKLTDKCPHSGWKVWRLTFYCNNYKCTPIKNLKKLVPLCLRISKIEIHYSSNESSLQMCAASRHKHAEPKLHIYDIANVDIVHISSCPTSRVQLLSLVKAMKCTGRVKKRNSFDISSCLLILAKGGRKKLRCNFEFYFRRCSNAIVF